MYQSNHILTKELRAEINWLAEATGGKAAIRPIFQPIIKSGLIVGGNAHFEITVKGQELENRIIAPTILQAIKKFKAVYTGL